MTVERRNIRVSKDWIDNKWVDIMAKPDILSIITSWLNPMPKVSLPILSGSPLADSRVLSSSKRGGTQSVNQQLPSSSSSASKKAVEDLRLKELLKIKENEDWTRRSSVNSDKGGATAKTASLLGSSRMP